MKILLFILKYGRVIGIVMVALGFLLIPFFIGIPVFVTGILLSVFSFYRNWFLRIVPEKIRHKIGADIAESYKPYHPALYSMTKLFGDMLKVASGIFGLFVIVTVTLIYISMSGNSHYWECNKEGVWTKNGRPDYPVPVIPCNISNPLPKDKDLCLARGGVWAKQGPDPYETCNRKAIDRGNLCRDNNECEGWCQVDVTSEELKQGMSGEVKTRKKYGQCSVWVVELGCFGMMEKGKTKGICID